MKSETIKPQKGLFVFWDFIKIKELVNLTNASTRPRLVLYDRSRLTLI